MFSHLRITWYFHMWRYQIINGYWTRFRKISWFASGEQINYLPKPNSETNNWSARHWQITIFCANRGHSLFYRSITNRSLKGQRSDRSAIFTQEPLQEEEEKLGFIYARAENWLQLNTVERHCAWADHYLWAIICRSCGVLPWVPETCLARFPVSVTSL